MVTPLHGFSGNIADVNLPLVLVSPSSQCLALLRQINVEPDYLYSPKINKTPEKGEYPLHFAKRLARENAEQAEEIIRSFSEFKKFLILSVDTVVTVGRLILPEPEEEKEAIYCLQLLSGRNHKVYTAICLITEKGYRRYRIVKNRVRFSLLNQQSINTYVATGEWKGKAGGYTLHGKSGAFVQRLVGSYSAIIGIPLTETLELLHAYGYKLHQE